MRAVVLAVLLGSARGLVRPSGPYYKRGHHHRFFFHGDRRPASTSRTAPTGPLRATTDLSETEIRKMRAGAIQKELKDAGVRYDDCFDKDDLIKRLIESREAPDKFRIKADTPKKPPSATASEPRAEKKEAGRKSRSRDGEGEGGPKKEPMAPEEKKLTLDEYRAQGQKMRLKALQDAIKGMGVSTKGMFEKTELVEAYAKAKVEGVSKSKSAAASSSDDDWDDDDVIELKTTKMPKGGGGAEGDPGMPGMGSKMGGMGGMGGMPGGGMPGGMGGIDLGSILSGMMGGGSMPNSMGERGTMGGGMGGIQALIEPLIRKAMGNPKLIATIEKAASNPRAMTAIQDVIASGPSAMGKYANDPEIEKILDELKSIL